MTTRVIGSIEMSLAGLGCNNFGRRIDEDGSRAVIEAALDAGITTFDTADIYGDGASETFLGRTIGARRDDVVVVSKFGMGTPPAGQSGGHPTYVAAACDASLERLGTDRIDVYLHHTPDEAVPVAETLGALAELVAAGKVREIGCSNYSAAQLDAAEREAARMGIPRFVTVQNEYSLLHREPEAEVLPACERLGLTFMPYFPLASGLLTGKYRRGEAAPVGSRLARPGFEDDLRDARFEVVEQLEAFAADRGHTLLELALSWLAARPAVSTVIAGATTPEQVRANVTATGAWDLSSEELAGVDRLAPAG
jgi:aryl-alcohol dehydrogenase-like predicted oxidoreductase